MPITRDSLMRWIIPDVGFHQNHYAVALQGEMKPRCRWLDIGAGTRLHDGFGAAPTPQQLAGIADVVIGVDLVVDHLRMNPCLTAAAAADAGHLPFRDGSFDLITANMVVEHLPKPEVVFAEITRVLAPGGRFVFVTPHLHHPMVFAANALLPRRVKQMLATVLEGRAGEHVFPTFYRANSTDAVRRCARTSGLEVERLDILRNGPILSRPLVGVFFECLFIKATAFGPLRRFGADLLAVLKRREALSQ